MQYTIGHTQECAIGGVSDPLGRFTRRLLSVAIQAIIELRHRTGENPDGTSDGVGINLAYNPEWARKLAAQAGYANQIANDQRVIITQLFIDKSVKLESVIEVASEVLPKGLELIERKVPVNDIVLAPMALETMPNIHQLLLVGKALRPKQEYRLERKLVRTFDKAFGVDQGGCPKVYLNSCSSRQVVYKGLMSPENLAVFFEDLQDDDLKISAAIFHGRFATNTEPAWSRAQPGRYSCHNGEVNSNETIKADVRALEATLPEKMLPLLFDGSTDSGQADTSLGAIGFESGLGIGLAYQMFMPPIFENAQYPKFATDFYQALAGRHTPGQGPAAKLGLMPAMDGSCMELVAHLDPNGLRPLQTTVSDGIFYAASERAAYPQVPIGEMEKRPDGGHSIFVTGGNVYSDLEVVSYFKDAAPWSEIALDVVEPEIDDHCDGLDLSASAEDVVAEAIRAGLDHGSLRIQLENLMTNGGEMLTAMGNGSPTPVLSDSGRPILDYSPQDHAMVTNPPLDPIREALKFSVSILYGKRLSPFDFGPRRKALKMSSVLSPGEMSKLRDFSRVMTEVSLNYDPAQVDLSDTLRSIEIAVKEMAESGSKFILLSTGSIPEGACSVVVVPFIAAVCAARKGLEGAKALRDTILILDSSEIHSSAEVAAAISYGANAVYPSCLYQFCVKENLTELGDEEMILRIKSGLELGLKKTMAKMGIPTVEGYCGGRHHHVLDLDNEVAQLLGSDYQAGGDGFDKLQKTYAGYLSFSNDYRVYGTITDHGIVRSSDSERERFDGRVIDLIRKIVGLDSNEEPNLFQDLKALAAKSRTLSDYHHSRKPFDMIGFLRIESDRKARAVVFSLAALIVLFGRIFTGAMSRGALTENAHSSIAQGSQIAGDIANSGEGGLPPQRKGKLSANKARQVSTGRFGVDSYYVATAELLDIKMGQGAKAGQGGELPGSKVDSVVAAIRHANEGYPLISPPPHNDIYSIEDLCQLIFTLGEYNPTAAISVKLPLKPGAPAVACGVVKAGATHITLSGYEGGSAATPETSRRHTGYPKFVTLCQVISELAKQGLLDKIILQIDGGLGLSGKEIVILSMLGVRTFGIGSGFMVSQGCIMYGTCQTKCPTGVATEFLNTFDGRWEYSYKFSTALKLNILEELAAIGYKDLDEVWGRKDLLRFDDEALRLYPGLDSFLEQSDAEKKLAGKLPMDKVVGLKPHREPRDFTDWLTQILSRLDSGQLDHSEPLVYEKPLEAADRAAFCRFFGELVRRELTPVEPGLTFKVHGMPGQSLAYWAPKGIRIELDGVIPDYAFSGNDGADGIQYLSSVSPEKRHELCLAGAVVGHGAISGNIVLPCTSGSRLGILNSGANIGALGAGENAGVFAKRGRIIILGEVGQNIGGGMNGPTDGNCIIVPDAMARFRSPNDTKVTELTDELWADVQTMAGLLGDEAVYASMKRFGGLSRGNLAVISGSSEPVEVPVIEHTVQFKTAAEMNTEGLEFIKERKKYLAA